MTDEDALLARIRATPADDTARLVYADWLEEQETPGATAKAEYLRADHELAHQDYPDDDPRATQLILRLRELAKELPHGWAADVARVPIHNCKRLFQFRCPLQWDKLVPTENAKIRFCTVCEMNVHYCESEPEARRIGASGQCVALSLRLDRAAAIPQPTRNHEESTVSTIVGSIIQPEPPPTSDPPNLQRVAWWQIWRR